MPEVKKLSTALLFWAVLSGCTAGSTDTSARSAAENAAESLPLKADALRTPESRFTDLPDYPFAPNYLAVDGYRVHYLNEGPADGPVVLLLHGEPTWSYLYRKMIPPLSEAGIRTITPDLIGFGKSDKPKDQATHTYAFHVAAMSELVNALDLRDVTFFGQDWGGLIGLRVVAENADRFAAVVVSNTALPTGEKPLSPAFTAWRATNRRMIQAGDIPTGAMLAQSTGDPGVKAAYDAPFPDPSYKAGALIMPQRVPVTPDDPARAANERAWQVFAQWDKPFVTAFGDADPVTGGYDREFQSRIPGAKGQPHVVLEGGKHFIQESHAEELAEIITRVVGK